MSVDEDSKLSSYHSATMEKWCKREVARYLRQRMNDLDLFPDLRIAVGLRSPDKAGLLSNKTWR